MHRSLVIVDDFLDNAQQFREAALRLDYPALKGQFPGRNSSQRINIGGLAEEISYILGEPVRPLNPPESHGKFRVTLAGDTGRGKVHVDAAHWSGILYMTRDEDARGGTEFFRHKRTGTDRAPVTPAELAACGYASSADMHRDIIERDGTSDEAWDMIMQVPMRFNRLVLLRPWLWHTAGPGFGDSIANGRLIYLLFFESAR